MFKSNRDYKLYIEDIAYECKNIKKFVENITYDEFSENLEKVYAVAKAFENIGEAVKNITSNRRTVDVFNRYVCKENLYQEKLWIL